MHLAQLNLAQAVDASNLEDFYALVPEVNALAEAAPGFIWRDKSGNGPFTEPGLLVNLSVWESIEALKAFTYHGRHVEVFRQKARWFQKPEQPMTVLWWIEEGHLPTLEEARQRLEHLRQHGPGPFAFTFASVPQDSPK